MTVEKLLTREIPRGISSEMREYINSEINKIVFAINALIDVVETPEIISAVTSVNGEVGDVVVTPASIGALQGGDNVSALVNDANYLEAGSDVSALGNDANYISSDNVGIGNVSNLVLADLDTYAKWAAIPVGTFFQPDSVGRTFLVSNVDVSLPSGFAFGLPTNTCIIKLPSHAVSPSVQRFLAFTTAPGGVGVNYGKQFFIQLTAAGVVYPDQIISMETFYFNPVPWLVPSYTVATVPSAGSNINRLISVSDDVGGRVIAMSNGTNWLRAYDNAPVSTT